MRRLRIFGGTGAPAPGAIDLAPMLDVVFILLIFFIVTASFVADTGIQVERPVAATAETARSVRILVAVAADDRIWIDGHHTDAHRLRLRIEALRAENPHGTLVVQADAHSSAAAVARVLDAARAAGIADAALSVQRK